jgi:hypothetical protein
MIGAKIAPRLKVRLQDGAWGSRWNRLALGAALSLAGSVPSGSTSLPSSSTHT